MPATPAVTQVDLNPYILEILTTESVPFTVEWMDLIGVGNTVSTPVGYLYDNSNGVLILNGFSNNYGVNATQTQYIIQGQYLQKNHKYTAILFVNVGTQAYAQRLQISTPR